MKRPVSAPADRARQGTSLPVSLLTDRAWQGAAWPAGTGRWEVARCARTSAGWSRPLRCRTVFPNPGGPVGRYTS